MTAHKIIIVALLFFAFCAIPDARAASPGIDCILTQLMNRDNRSQTCLELRNTLRDKERSKMLLQDRALFHGMLQQQELRQEMLRHPRFMRQMIQSGEIRQELLQNEQMMNEMLENRGVNREINRNREMMEEIEKNETYRKKNQELQADILEELLLESTVYFGDRYKDLDSILPNRICMCSKKPSHQALLHSQPEERSRAQT